MNDREVERGRNTVYSRLAGGGEEKVDRDDVLALGLSTLDWRYYASSLQQYSDSEILLKCSTSPSSEGPDFVDNERRVFDYLIKYPDWRRTFPMRKPRVFERAPDGGWTSSRLLKNILDPGGTDHGVNPRLNFAGLIIIVIHLELQLQLLLKAQDICLYANYTPDSRVK
ncbi:hypothetical protein MRB53_006984 [Persea americana]|uniref:Uncharacterized protein n=1 Tax=Persea americana TaxID=3435 RepID=A0ACC2MHL4_PERAE|nr:hypothetical protein MRB53_006984 [Persea americana]